MSSSRLRPTPISTGATCGRNTCCCVAAGNLRLIEPEPLVKIGRVAVSADERGHGFARTMMEAALQRAAEVYPHRDVGLSAQTYLEPFYQSLGFVAVSAPYDDYGVPHIDMVGPARGI